MTRFLLPCAVLVAAGPAVFADQTITKAEMLIRLTVSPKAAPKPALRYLLLPDLREMHAGNPIPAYLKCALVEESPDREAFGRASLREADRAARLDKPDWGILQRAKLDGINLLLPDVQKMRALAAALQERFREENGQHRVDDSLRTAKTMFALSRHMGEHPTLIGNLVGIAIANVAIAPLEDFLEQPGAPNLYWALTNLPTPFLPLDKGMEGERLFMMAELRDLDDTKPMTPAQIKKLTDHIDKILAFDTPKKTTRPFLDARTKSEAGLKAARERLVEVGYAADALAKMPADQVILLDEKRAYEVRRDDELKLHRLPPWEIEKRIGPEKKTDGLFEGFIPATNKVRRAQTRLDQRVALLRCVEALRLYAAGHDGKFPAKLADCEVPLPLDPFTGKPFRYELEGDVAHVRGSPPVGLEKEPSYNVHYQITLRK